MGEGWGFMERGGAEGAWRGEGKRGAWRGEG